MKSSCLVLCLLILVASAQFGHIHGRTLRSDTVSGCGEDRDQDHRGASMGAMASFAFSSNSNETTRPYSVRSLAAKLASGPSKKGPGH
ncbi:hypothetical protein EUGRSUZ_F02277 [Eucalyptus grandis]|uniref:Uncharacterized protein n=3 Tax=Eucalyptus TaxID=3932 RepID=A0ACC3KGI3_EUCGR|nr:hypothetical protein EUGRSUZ_F02277 [Eucalyptus grandis]